MVSFLSSSVRAQRQLTEHTLQLDEGSAPNLAKLEDFQWLVGRWVGEGLGGQCEETFLPPWNGTMVGTFRYAKDGKLVFSEFFMLAESDDGMILKLKHFHPDFVGWEEKDGMVNFPLIRVEHHAAYFGGLTYRLTDDGQLKAWVAMKRADGQYSEGSFVLRRAEEPSVSSTDEMNPQTIKTNSEIADTASVAKAIRKSVVVECSRETAWNLWTTSEGIAKFFSPDSTIELKAGGKYEMYFGLEPDEHGIRGSEGSRVISYIPHEMLLFEWNFPPNTPELRRAKKRLPVKITFRKLSEKETQVDLIHYGWQEEQEDGLEWETGFNYFNQVWPHVLESFKAAAEKE